MTVDGNLTVNGDLALGDDITINDTLLVNGVATFKGGLVSTGTAAAPTSNTVIGSGAGAALQSGGTDNVMIGLNAGQLVSTVDDLVAIGSGALDANTTGIRHVAIGKNALGANSTGSTNVAIGEAALALNTTSGNNVAIGYESMYSGTTGYSNAVAVGNLSLQVATIAGSTVAVGHGCCRFTGPGGTVDTIYNSVLIGSDARPLGDNQSNQIVIGTGAVGNGSNTTTIGTSSTTGTYLNGPSTFSVGANGQSTQLGQATTLLTGLTGATVTATNLIPANCILLGVTARVTTAITGATTFDIGDGSTANRFGDDIAIALNTTANNCIAPALISAATSVVLTANGSNFTAGAVRVTAHYMTLVAPTS